ncbi:conserved hypothetical protein [Gloeothece citriformis PCC 7424]|uniref:Uncharacterized protein n=1 Tax=Gloeothece citriformis (strain PCC 7424) TaxID=65393 RepID=B7KJU7_GLOC7|nr:hypothetical protein [Gloeothece citriformis]ACK69546.1 conserved hypothetical protein [Gloeothece citriformis PCC 7424]
MMSSTVWGPLTVEQFFKDYNWLGEPPKFPSLETEFPSEKPTSWLCLSVEEFLGKNTWKAQPVIKQKDPSPVPPPTLSLTLPVNEFLQWAAWGGQTEKNEAIKPLSKPSNSVYNCHDSHNYNLNDLSDLF